MGRVVGRGCAPCHASHLNAAPTAFQPNRCPKPAIQQLTKRAPCVAPTPAPRPQAASGACPRRSTPPLRRCCPGPTDASWSSGPRRAPATHAPAGRTSPRRPARLQLGRVAARRARGRRGFCRNNFAGMGKSCPRPPWTGLACRLRCLWWLLQDDRCGIPKFGQTPGHHGCSRHARLQAPVAVRRILAQTRNPKVAKRQLPGNSVHQCPRLWQRPQKGMTSGRAVTPAGDRVTSSDRRKAMDLGAAWGRVKQRDC